MAAAVWISFIALILVLTCGAIAYIVYMNYTKNKDLWRALHNTRKAERKTRKQLEATKKSVEKTKTLVYTIQDDVSLIGDNVKSSLSDINGTVSSIQGEVVQVDGNLDSTKQELTLYKNYIGTIQQSIADIIKDVQSLQRTGTYTAQSQEELKRMIADLNSTTDQVNAMKATVDKISADVHGLQTNTSDITSFKTQLQTNTSDITSFKTQMQTNTTNIASTNTTLAAVQAKLSEISAAISAVPSSSRLDVLQASYDELKKTLATMDYSSRIDALQASYDQLKKTLASLDSNTVKAVGSDSLAVKSSVCVGDKGVCVLGNTINTGGGVQSGRLHIMPKEALFLLPKGGTHFNTFNGADPKISMSSELKGKHAQMCIDGSCMIGDFGGKSGRLHVRSPGDVFMLPAKGTFFTADWGATPTIKMVSGAGKTAQLCIDNQCLTSADLLKLKNL
jgi:predicted  nucleic acid-binding Zn-ribbon protein